MDFLPQLLEKKPRRYSAFMGFLFFLFLCTFAFSQEEAPPPLPAFEEPREIAVNNVILARINEKTISVVDVMKKMDVFLNQNYPQYAGSKMARFQFYSGQWRHVLAQLIENELMLADAEQAELKIPEGDVRETLMQKFGPNVMANLEKIGITYEEAKEMIHTELLVQKMYWYRVNSKALLNVNPQDVKLAFKDYCVKNPPEETWNYQVFSIRAQGEEKASRLTEKAQELLKEPDVTLELVHTRLQDAQEEQEVSMTLSPPTEVQMKALSEAHKAVLSVLRPGEISHPAKQKSRDGATVYRFFHLKDHVKKEPPTFEQMADTLHDQLMEKAVEKETASYLKRLRRKFSFEEKTLADDFQPFVLK